MTEKIKVGSRIQIKNREYKVTGISWEMLGPSEIVVYYLDDGSSQLVWEDYRGKAGPHGVNLYLSRTEKVSRRQLIEDLKDLVKFEEGKVKIRKTSGKVPFLVSDKGRYISCAVEGKKGAFVLFELYDDLVLKDEAWLISREEVKMLGGWIVGGIFKKIPWREP